MNTKIFDQRFILLISFQLLFSLAIIFSIKYFNCQHTNTQNLDWKDLGAKMQVLGLSKQANYFYQNFLNTESDANSKLKSNLAFKMASLFEEQADLENALAHYHLVAAYDLNGEYVEEAKKKIVQVLEKMNKHMAAKMALKEQSQLASNDQPISGGDVVAKINGRPIFLHSINEAIDTLPEQMRGEFKDPNKKREFVQKYVADELLWEKGRRQNILEDGAMKKKIMEIEKQLVVNSILQKEIFEKISVDEADLKNYFQLNSGAFAIAGPSLFQVAVFESEKDANSFVEKIKKVQSAKRAGSFATIAQGLKAKNSKEVDQVLSLNQGSSYLDNPLLTQAIQSLKSSEVSDPKALNNNFYVFFAKNASAKKSPAYEEVKDWVKQKYSIEKGQGRYQEFLANLLKSENVEFMLDQVK